MKKLVLSFAAVSAVLATGCGKQDTAQTQSAPPCNAGTSCKAVVKNEDARNYFSRFFYSDKPTCTDKSFKFNSLTLSDRLVVAKATDGSDILADIQLFLQDDGSYTGVYQEKTVKRGEEGVTVVTAINNRKDLNGNWSIQIVDGQGPELMVDGFGGGIPVNSRGWPGVQFTLPKDETLNATLSAKQISFIQLKSSTSKDGKTLDQLCPATEGAK